ncbi:MAG: hypothetical protein BWY82_01318 [Verrucomicrobia bacterium ADurb.Bin474]|nr:MAG: hypothetical protein BWY82_01318 [Verrucomicrobia bacterium ADurb.Bin474]
MRFHDIADHEVSVRVELCIDRFLELVNPLTILTNSLQFLERFREDSNAAVFVGRFDDPKASVPSNECCSRFREGLAG